jgi:hypothetical protein
VNLDKFATVLFTSFKSTDMLALGTEAFQVAFRQRLALALGVSENKVEVGQTSVSPEGLVIQSITLYGNDNASQGKVASAEELYDQLLQQLGDPESLLQQDPILASAAAARTCPDGEVRVSCEEESNSREYLYYIVAAVVFLAALGAGGVMLRRMFKSRQAELDDKDAGMETDDVDAVQVMDGLENLDNFQSQVPRLPPIAAAPTLTNALQSNFPAAANDVAALNGEQPRAMALSGNAGDPKWPVMEGPVSSWARARENTRQRWAFQTKDWSTPMNDAPAAAPAASPYLQRNDWNNIQPRQ